MPVVISKRVIFTFAGCVVLVSFIYGTQTYDYMYELGRGVMTEDQALYQLERSGFMQKARELFLHEVQLGTIPNDVEIHPK